MKKIKMTIAAAMFCAAAFAGYTAYEKATMTSEEKLFRANLEALTGDEFSDSNVYTRYVDDLYKDNPFYCCQNTDSVYGSYCPYLNCSSYGLD